jgi:hypothetical protein
MKHHRFQTYGLAALTMLAAVLTAFIPQICNATEWKQTVNRPNQWSKELGELPGERVLLVEYHHPNILYLYRVRCAGPKEEYSVVSWYKGASVARGRGCGTNRFITSTDTSLLERRGGALPLDLTELQRKRTKGK